MVIPSPEEIYTADFFAAIQGGSAGSAEAVAPVVHDWLRPARVLDVGCGSGEWLAPFARLGSTVLGVDGTYVDRTQLAIEDSAFRAHDLREPLPPDVLGWAADLVLCLEVAEHLPAARGPLLVEELTQAAPRVLFSAAVPGQGGHGHVNERPHAYWEERFEDAGFAVTRVLRRRLADDDRVAWWYRHNLVLAVRV